jgi:hypothetical protein
MAPNDVFLHIGAPKTGTTYLQDMLWANKDVLERAGVLVPGHYRYARVPAIRDFLKWDPTGTEPPPHRWRRLTREINRWRGRSAVLSQEFMCRMTDVQTHALVESFGNTSVHGILAVRDISRLVPAQWQTLMRSRKGWRLADFAAAVAGVSQHPQAEQMNELFWRRHDYPTILQRWIAEVGKSNVIVMTVPQSGSDPGELWRRLCVALDVDASTTASAEPTHESLGAASAELMRQLNQHKTVRAMSQPSYQRSVNTAISRRGLVDRRDKEPRLTMPPEHADWAARVADEHIAMITDLGVRVIGDLEDLRPVPSSTQHVVPDELTTAELLSASIDGLAGLVAEHAKLTHADEAAPVPGGRSGHADATGAGRVKRLKAAWRRRSPVR